MKGIAGITIQLSKTSSGIKGALRFACLWHHSI
jgi:hypothetical protein